MKKILFTAIYFLIFPPALTIDTLKPGERLNSSSYLVSSRKIFTLGFYTPQNTTRSYLAIWYTNDARYPVWLANRDIPIFNNSGFLSITNTGKLILFHNGAVPIDLFEADGCVNVAATLLDTGNFVLKDLNSSSGEIFWQSFDYPTDVLLPGMKLGVNHRTGRNWTLRSWLSQSNPASGAFSLEWDTVRHSLVVRRRGLIYWTSGELKFYYEYGNSKFYGFENILPKHDPIDFTYALINATSKDEDYFTYSLYREIVSGMRLDYRGSLYDYDGVKLVRVDLCYGYNTRGDEVYLGCELWDQPKCRNKHQTFSFKHGYFQFNTVERSYENDSSLSISDCRANCWNDCKCVAFLDEEIGCSYWRGENAKFLQDSSFTSERRYFLTTSPLKKRVLKKWIAIPVTIAFLLLLVSTSLIVWRRHRKGKRQKMEELQELMSLDGYTETYELENEGVSGLGLKMFTYASIISSTDNFSQDNKLGEGGFGPVYKGKVKEGSEIAVKLLSQSSGQGFHEFKTELLLISKLQHRNLVKLLGFCIHENEKMIIYDYMPNKSLDSFLFDPEKCKLLSWATRFSIIEGIAQGLLYLHKHSRLTIVHRDLKASNILLDENMNPKISDFGLARIFKQNVTEAKTKTLVGTYGYMAPEYVMHGKFSVKSDIYSFGVLVLEIVSGRRNNSFTHPEGPQSLVDLAWELWEQYAELELVDPRLMEDWGNKDQVRRCIRVGLLCVQNLAIDRPPIEDVMSMLKDGSSILPVPKKPAFILRDDVFQNLELTKLKKLSVNQVSLSTVQGR